MEKTINNVRKKPYKQTSPIPYEIFLNNMERELKTIKRTWESKNSKDAREKDPEFARGYLTAIYEMLGLNEEVILK